MIACWAAMAMTACWLATAMIIYKAKAGMTRWLRAGAI